eukprot:296393_1
MALRRITKELEDLNQNPVPNCSMGPENNNMFTWKAILVGPENTPYFDGIFDLHIRIPQDYPFKPPKISFITPIYHCDINSNGSISLDPLQDNWSPDRTLHSVFVSIISLLRYPNADDPLVPAIARLYKTNRRLFNKRANDMAVKYASAPKQNYNVVDIPSIKTAVLQYDARIQQITCDVEIEHAAEYDEYKEHMKKMYIVCMKHKEKVKMNQTQYRFNIHKEIEYGTTLAIQMWVEHASVQRTSKWFTIFVDILTMDKYQILIEGFLNNKQRTNKIVPKEIIHLCFGYYWKFVVHLQSVDVHFEKHYALSTSHEIKEVADISYGGCRYLKSLPRRMKQDIWDCYENKRNIHDVKQSEGFPKTITFCLK